MKRKKKQLKTAPPNGGEVIIYKGPGKTAHLEVRLRDETLWLNQRQIAELFTTDRSVITKHLRNIFASGELDEKSNVQKMHIPFSDKPIKLYNLDIVISLGYRVNSQRATQFRIWATKTLRDHIVRGYTINEQRLREHAERAEVAGQTQELLSVIQDYTNSLTLLYEYDKGALVLRRKKHSRFVLTHDLARALIAQTKEALQTKGEASDLFGQEYGDNFKSVLGSI